MTQAPTPTVLEIWTDGACKKIPVLGDGEPGSSGVSTLWSSMAAARLQPTTKWS